MLTFRQLGNALSRIPSETRKDKFDRENDLKFEEKLLDSFFLVVEQRALKKDHRRDAGIMSSLKATSEPIMQEYQKGKLLIVVEFICNVEKLELGLGLAKL